ncbi:hypothetical protein VNI00_007278 [Paramarasmius palmivorus]|uniref:Uncharacterized protein n=1 Tax=Paramarasmius palmivorus TaxID=297713 RepID=A0AAW0D0E2_9AGAR
MVENAANYRVPGMSKRGYPPPLPTLNGQVGNTAHPPLIPRCMQKDGERLELRRLSTQPTVKN